MTTKQKCKESGCDRQSSSKGLCKSHYQQNYLGKPITPLRGPGGQLGEEPLVTFGVRVSGACADALDMLGGRSTAARIILEQEAPHRAAALEIVIDSDVETFSGERPEKKKRRNGA